MSKNTDMTVRVEDKKSIYNIWESSSTKALNKEVHIYGNSDKDKKEYSICE